jgi:hypothetical protein
LRGFTAAPPFCRSASAQAKDVGPFVASSQPERQLDVVSLMKAVVAIAYR